MIVVDKYVDMEDLRAETLLAQHYPDVDEWTVRHDSFFRRNYVNDLQRCDPGTRQIFTSRNGLYQVLPEKMFFDEQELRNKNGREFTARVNEIMEQEQTIKSYFMPFDTAFFNLSMQIERAASEAVRQSISNMLKRFFDFDLENEPNRYIRRFAPMLLHVSRIRGDIRLISDLLSHVFRCPVTWENTSPIEIRFVIHKRGLVQETHREFMEQLGPFFGFLQDWFLPVPVSMTFAIKDFKQAFVLSDTAPLVLDYNTQL